MDYIKKLPMELQKKILYYSMIHNTADMINKLKSNEDIKSFQVCYNIEQHIYYKESLYNMLRLLNKLKSNYYSNDYEDD